MRGANALLYLTQAKYGVGQRIWPQRFALAGSTHGHGKAERNVSDAPQIVVARYLEPRHTLELCNVFTCRDGGGSTTHSRSSPPPNELASGWTFRVIPYAWLSGLYGSSTVKGRTVGVNLPFDKLLEKTVGKGNFPSP